MLIGFSFENYLSFKDRQAVVTTPDALKEHQEYLHVPYLYDNEMRILKSIAIYGHNSHGKSNFISAYSFFLNFIFSSFAYGKTDSTIEIENFKLNTASRNQSTFFEILFLLKDVKYRYGFEVISNKIIAEWLFYAEGKSRENHLFLRSFQETKINKNWNKTADNKIEQALIFTKPHNLLLSVLIAQENIPRIGDLAGWLWGNIIISDTSGSKHLSRSTLILMNPQYRNLVYKFLDNADLGFLSVKEKIDVQVNKKLALDTELLDVWYAPELKEFELYTLHEIYDKDYKKIETIFFELIKNESSGTIKYFVLACYLAYAIKQGQLILIDELDSKFHALLLQYMLKVYNDPKINSQGSQLIFTTHNTILINSKFLRRDQFLVVEKNKFGESSIKRMHNSKNPARIDVSMEREYIKGKFGGISRKLKDENQQSSLDFEN